MEKLYEGKAKIVYTGPEVGTYRVYYKDDATAFNGQKRAQIGGKGVVNNRVSSTLFRYLEAHGVPTHFLGELSEREMLVRQVEIIPLEVIIRNRAAGSFAKRYGVAEGTPLAKPLVEFSLKNDALGDPLIYDDAVLALGLASANELSRIKELALQVNELLKAFFSQRGLEVIDFKLEFGRLPGGTVVLADEISPDTMRLWEVGTGEKMDKDRFRRDLGGVEEAYQEVLRRVTGGPA
ncbi:phosphoribosylaminoimidazole-succinocarboxamide synthase [Allomeiothermus silvanus DSM 9946]|uniref:Phosphoribosylaminoimidazole-succinocarboxamide synthase n=1 Tax=Allomeiothermus silvanus (strain ATCC 700542 / DSM 9946 / NBRC 106475 / NCIMB 13440 / VI-R2) TaxID=526227 RepID=D7BD44_ALLS1|nr:phosphoribosylaminoimidazolesuccinocarboxamide synthase [Allomeiothermus silvanus]ADH62962.1 phosphoribosylaminoimidazole-succinocarboxamide synthase [Allomeiothermus silvanus DSM 9946]MBI5811458.1 phosphoribosylaminoimidazolesuccinocarboxamide synthase [Allomeiothermus silvanus]